MTIPLEELSNQCLADENYAWKIHCMIATAISDDSEDPSLDVPNQEINMAAARIMKSLFGVDVKTTVMWRNLELSF